MAVDDPVGQYVPAGQRPAIGVGELIPALHAYPAVHSAVGLVRPVVAQYEPGVHVWHTVADVAMGVVLNVPLGQANSLPALVWAGQYEPGWHVYPAATGSTVPMGQ